jgi:hypothetical protein
MGRGIASAPLDVQTVQQAFALRQDGSLLRRRCHIEALSGEPATFIGPSGKRMARFSVNGKIRRIAASRIAWALHYREWPTGPVRPKNGDPDDLRADNLVQTRHGAHRPNAAGGRASSLERRHATNAALLSALAERAMLLRSFGEAGAPRFGLRAALQRSPPLEFDGAGRGACRIRQSRGP